VQTVETASQEPEPELEPELAHVFSRFAFRPGTFCPNSNDFTHAALNGLVAAIVTVPKEFECLMINFNFILWSARHCLS
jgi:hypothetical protein